MAKIKLADGTMYPISDYATTSRILICMEGLAESEIISSLTGENLSDVQFLTDTDVAFCVMKNKGMRGHSIEGDTMIIEIDDMDLCRVALILGDDGRILDVVPQRYATDEAMNVDTLPDGDFCDYRCVDGEYIFDPLPKDEEEIKPTQEERITALEHALTAIEEGIASV